MYLAHKSKVIGTDTPIQYIQNPVLGTNTSILVLGTAGMCDVVLAHILQVRVEYLTLLFLNLLSVTNNCL